MVDDHDGDAVGGSDGAPAGDGSDGEWAVSLDDLTDDEEPAPLEPGEVNPEHAAFVLLGAAVTLLAVLVLLL